LVAGCNLRSLRGFCAFTGQAGRGRIVFVATSAPGIELAGVAGGQGNGLLRIGGELEEGAVFGFEKAGLDDGVEEGEEGVPVVCGVDEDDGFGVEA